MKKEEEEARRTGKEDGRMGVKSSGGKGKEKELREAQQRRWT